MMQRNLDDGPRSNESSLIIDVFSLFQDVLKTAMKHYESTTSRNSAKYSGGPSPDRLPDNDDFANLSLLVIESDRLAKKSKTREGFITALGQLINSSTNFSNAQVIEYFASIYQERYGEIFPFNAREFEKVREINSVAGAISAILVKQYERERGVTFSDEQKQAVNGGVKNAITCALSVNPNPDSEFFNNMIDISIPRFSKIIPNEISDTRLLKELVFDRIMYLWGHTIH